MSDHDSNNPYVVQYMGRDENGERHSVFNTTPPEDPFAEPVATFIGDDANVKAIEYAEMRNAHYRAGLGDAPVVDVTTPDDHAEAIARIVDSIDQDTPTPEEDTVQAIAHYYDGVIAAAEQAAYCDGWLDAQGGYEHSYGPEVEAMAQAARNAADGIEYVDDHYGEGLSTFRSKITFGDYSEENRK